MSNLPSGNRDKITEQRFFITLLFSSYLAGTVGIFLLTTTLSPNIWLIWFAIFIFFMFTPFVVALTLKRRPVDLAYSELIRMIPRRRLYTKVVVLADICLYILLTAFCIMQPAPWIDVHLKWSILLLAPGILFMCYAAWQY